MAKVTMLSWMASKDFTESLDLHQKWGIDVLDLKDHIFGKSILDLSLNEAVRAAEMIQSRNLKVHCLSTQIFQEGIEQGEKEYSSTHLQSITHIIEIARILKPQFVRLLPAHLSDPQHTLCSAITIPKFYPWLYQLYREAVDQLTDSGFLVAIENECDTIFSNVDDILNFFGKLDRMSKAFLTYDVQNLWQMGTYPSMEVYTKLKPLIGYLHVKGGQQLQGTEELKWKSALEDASWPVQEITRQVVADGVSEVICINPTHGELKDNYDYSNLFKRDLDYMKKVIQSN